MRKGAEKAPFSFFTNLKMTVPILIIFIKNITQEGEMKIKIAVILAGLVFFANAVGAQDKTDYVDVKQTNEVIARLQTQNDDYKTAISANEERKTFLENRIKTSEDRLSKIKDNLDYASQTMLDLNSITKETKDRETLAKLEKSRSELRSVIWLLTTEQTRLEKQTAEDKDEVDFITKDTARRQAVIKQNEEDIATLQQAVSDTESKINEVASKLETIQSRLDSLRSETSGSTNP